MSAHSYEKLQKRPAGFSSVLPLTAVSRCRMLETVDKVQKGGFVRHYRFGVPCNSCGQPIVLHDTPPGMLQDSARSIETLRLQCMSCGRRGHYRLAAFHIYETGEMSSGDWQAVPGRRRAATSSLRPPASQPEE